MSSNGSGTSVPQKVSWQNGEAKATLPNSRGSGTSVPHIKHSNLPHIDIEGYYQFITFRTFDSIDNYLKKLYNTEKINKQKQQAIDNYLDSSNNGAYLNGKVLEYLYDFFQTQDKKLYDLVAFCIMPNHVHLLFKPIDKLNVVMQKLKGATANHINKILNKSGKFWAGDYYDKAIRDEKHFFVVYEYIKNNPIKLGEAKCRTKDLLPNNTNGSGTSVPPYSEAKATLPNRFYGVYEEINNNE